MKTVSALPAVALLAAFLSLPMAGLLAATVAAAAPPTVGMLGALNAIEFEGNQSLPATALREGLAGAPEFLLAAHPSAPLADYPEVVRQALLRGYRNSGFPDVKVMVAPDPSRQQLRVKITEGPRFRSGDILVEGAQEVPAAELIRWLTEAHPKPADRLTAVVETVLQQWRTARGKPADGGGSSGHDDDDPVWTRDKPVSFAEDFPDRASARALAALAEHGHPLAAVTAVLRRDDAKGLAHLVLTVTEGPHGRIGELHVTGNHRNSAEEILQAAGLAAGQELTTGALARAKLALWNSARFFTFDVTTQPRNPPAREVDVTIEVEENDALPLLREPLAWHQAALVKFANWLTAQAGALSVEIVAADDIKLTLAIGPSQGTLLQLAGKENIRAVLVTSADGLRAYATANGRAAGREITHVPLRPDVKLSFLTESNPEHPGQHASFDLGFGASYNGDPTLTFRPEIIVAPSFAVEYLAKDKKPSLERGEVALIGSDGKSAIRFREDTGELVEWQQAFDGQTDSVRSINVRRGGEEFARLQKMLDGAWAGLPPPDAPRESLAALLLAQPLLRDWLKDSATSKETGAKSWQYFPLALRLTELLCESPELAALFSNNKAPADSGFSIPADPKTMRRPGMLVLMLGATYHRLAVQLWPADTWPGKLGREVFYIAAGQTKYTDAALRELDADAHMGPLGSLLTAQVLEWLNVPAAASDYFRRRARDHDSAEDFRNDWRALLDPHTAAGRIAQDFLRRLGAMHDDELAAFTVGLAPDETELLRQTMEALRGSKQDAPVEQALGPVLDRWWTGHLRPYLEK